MGERLTFDFMSLFCEKNSDGTKNLRLKGNELYYRIKKRLDDNNMYSIANYLSENPIIVKLDLCYNEIGDFGLQILIEELLSQENYVTHLNLVGCNITGDGVEKLCNTWLTLKLKTLRLTGNKIGFTGGAALEQLLLNLKTLENLDVGDTDQTLSSVPYFCSCLRADMGRNDTLKVLDISNIVPTSMFYQFSSSHLADQLGETIKMNFSLVEMHIQKCHFDGHDVELLLLGLKKNSTLLLLDIGYNRINNFGAELLARWLKTGPNLIGLNLAGNSIGEHGGTALSFGLPFSKIRLLDISKNKITDKAMAKILLSIKKTYRMRLFYVWGNELGPSSLEIMNRQINSGIYLQENIDFFIYFADDRLQAASYPSNEYKPRFYCQLSHAEVRELRIRRNRLESEHCEHKAKISLQFYDRIEGDRECDVDVGYTPRDELEERLKKCLP